MNILVVHNHYGNYVSGGEANVMQAEVELLESHGHEVIKIEKTNSEIGQLGYCERIRHFNHIDFSRDSYESIKQAIERFRPKVMHVHNYWFMLTPSVFKAAVEAGVRTVLTLHNYRLICPGNSLMRNSRICEDCFDGRPLRSLWHRCYPDGSFWKTYLSLRLYSRTIKSNYFSEWIDAYIALTEFGKKKFIEGGLPETKIFVKPNFMVDPIYAGISVAMGEYAVCVGRISPEKGVLDLMKAWRGIDFPLVVIGEGPQMEKVKKIAPQNVSFVGQKSRKETLDLVAGSAFFMFPSLWYEGFPLSLLEAMALGKAVIATDLGPRREMVDDGVSGFLYQTGDTNELQGNIRILIEKPKLRSDFGNAGRQIYLERYSPEMNYSMLIDIYNKILS